MRRNDKEFEELQQAFERTLPRLPGLYVGSAIKREAKNCPDYYTNGQVNNLFKLYMAGYQMAKSLARIGDLTLDE